MCVCVENGQQKRKQTVRSVLSNWKNLSLHLELSFIASPHRHLLRSESSSPSILRRAHAHFLAPPCLPHCIFFLFPSGRWCGSAGKAEEKGGSEREAQLEKREGERPPGPPFSPFLLRATSLSLSSSLLCTGSSSSSSSCRDRREQRRLIKSIVGSVVELRRNEPVKQAFAFVFKNQRHDVLVAE